ncbi:hypothetical protein C3E98_037145, partial [Pseudomonas sp. MWU13-2625]
MKIAEEDFALDVIDGEPAIIVMLNMLGQAGSEWEGSPVFGKSYLLELIGRSLEHNVILAEDIQGLIRKADRL